MSRAQSRMDRVRSGQSVPLFHHEGTGKERGNELHPNLVKQARKSGQLNLINRGWIEVPDQVWHINNFSNQEVKSLSFSMDETDDRWWDQVDLSRLSLANNQIAQISPEISNLGALQFLDLHDNKLVNLPDSLSQLVNLVRLDISRNAMTIIPPAVYALKDLRCLLANDNEIESLSDELSHLNRLEELNLSNNRINTIPSSIGFLPKIVKLYLNTNKLSEIPNDIGSMTALNILDLSNNKISILPVGVGELKRLVQLYVRHNNLKQFPILHACCNLKEIYFGNNMLVEINSAHLEPLVNLKILELRDNRLNSLPDSIVILSSLERLDLSNNYLTSLPNVLGLSIRLSSLSVEGNPIKNIRRDIMQRGTSHLLKFLRSRIEGNPEMVAAAAISGRPLSGEQIIASETWNLDQFVLRQNKTLNLANKQVRDIPNNVFVVAEECEVNNVILSKNLLTFVPEGLPRVYGHLKELDLGFNQLTTLANSIGNATHLIFLDVRSNKLENLPQEISELKHLREICISNNNFKEIPTCLFGIQKLEILMASDNHIQTIDVSGLSSLPVLTVLDLKNNDISKVPPELGNLKQLRALQLEGNVFRQPRPAILIKGTDAVLSYLRDRIPS